MRLKRKQNDDFPTQLHNLVSAICTLEELYIDFILEGASDYYDNSDNIKIYIPDEIEMWSNLSSLKKVRLPI